LILDVRPTDVTALVSDDCSAMRPYQKSTALATTIEPGSSVVGDHIQPGTYLSTTSEGCYAEAGESFDGSEGAIFANLFVDADEAGETLIFISPTDTAFYSSEECGVWTLQPAGGLVDVPNSLVSFSESDRLAFIDSH